MKKIKFIGVLLGIILTLNILTGQEENVSSIRPYENNPWYWQYQGEPVLLLGGSDDDNLFQWEPEQLIAHLDLMVSVGGNYVRNTMSGRDEGNLYAFEKTDEGKYDLDRWNEMYWDRLEFFLIETMKRRIFVHLTLWDQYDVRARGYELRTTSPWHPDRNINYGFDRGLETWEDFFYTVENKNEEVLRYQRRFVDRVLELTLEYDHILYNICNEGFTSFVWDDYWADRIREVALSKGKKAEITAMQMDAEATVRRVLSRPELYTFADISQVDQDALGLDGEHHMEAVLRWREWISVAGVRPMNHVKIYGSADERREAGTEVEAIRRFWRNIFGGSASVRFHRRSMDHGTSWGMGLNEKAQKTIRAARRFSEEFDLFASAPLPGLLKVVSASGAYCLGNPGIEYAVYLPAGGSVVLDPVVYTEDVEVRWLDIETLKVTEPEIHTVHWSTSPGMLKTQKNRGSVYLSAPTTDVFTYQNIWIALVKVKK